jgi:hypothetical protein
MAALAWLLIPLVAAVVASLWGSWAGRRVTTPDAAGVAGYERFRAAMERSGTPGGNGSAAAGERAAEPAAADARLASAGMRAPAAPDGPAREAD